MKHKPIVKITCDGGGCEASIEVAALYTTTREILHEKWSIDYNDNISVPVTHYCPDCRKHEEGG